MIEKNKELFAFGEMMQKDYYKLQEDSQTMEEKLIYFQEEYERNQEQIEILDENGKDMEYTLRKLYEEVDNKNH